MLGMANEFSSEERKILGVTWNFVSTKKIKRTQRLRLARLMSSSWVLGVTWNFVEDKLVSNLGNVIKLPSECAPTKRSIVHLSAKFYDQTSFMSAITYRFKILFQELCGEKLNWDQEVPHGLNVGWDNLVSELKQINCILLFRCYF